MSGYDVGIQIGNDLANAGFISLDEIVDIAVVVSDTIEKAIAKARQDGREEAYPHLVRANHLRP